MISLILPTRNRPDNLKRLFQSILDTTEKLNNIEISMRIDIDDMKSLDIIEQFPSLRIKGYVGSRSKNYGDYWNDAWKNASGEIFMMCGDDFVFRTKNWDKRIIEEFNKYPDKLIFVFGEDGLQHGNIGTHGFIHKNWTNLTGYFACPLFHVFYHDTWNDVIAKEIGRRIYIPELFFEHMHYSINKAPIDETYKEMSIKTTNDEEIWNKSEPVRKELVEKFKQFIKDYK